MSYLLGPRLDEILSRRASPVVYYYQDIQGSIRGLTGSNSKPIQAYEYTAFGERHVSSRSKQFLLLDKLIDQPYGFTGRPKEDLTGLYYYRYRDYNPETGRFLQPDPLGQLPGPNIYSYCQNNPVNWVDPWGMWVIRTRRLESQILSGLGENWLYQENPNMGQHWQMFYDNNENVGYLGDDKDNPSEPNIGADYSGIEYDDDYIMKGDDDDLMRQAEINAREAWESEYDSGQRYHHPVFDDERKFDCQEFIWKMIEEYVKLKNEINKGKCN